MSKIQTKAQMEYVKNKEAIEVLKTGRFIIFENDGRAVFIPEEDVIVRYDIRIECDKYTGEIIEHEELNPEKLAEMSEEGILTNKIGYSNDEDKDICEKISSIESNEYLYVPIKDLAFFGKKRKYRLEKNMVIITSLSDVPVGYILGRYVDEDEKEIRYGTSKEEGEDADE